MQHFTPPPATDSTPAKCKWDLRDSIFAGSDILVTTPIYYGKKYSSPIPGYKDVAYSGEEDCPISDGCSTQDTDALKYKVYYPKHNYTALKLPALIFIHGGGLSDCSNYSFDEIDFLCREFSKRGFVTFNAEYRRGRIIDIMSTNLKTVQQQLAAYRGDQDARGLVRSIIKRERYHVDSFPTDPYRIDTTNIFIGGNSGGALLAISAAYYRNQVMFDSAFPSPPGKPKIKTVLGPINADFYYGEPAVKYDTLIRGVFSMWGGVPIPLSFANKQDSFFYSPNPKHNPPCIGFQGLKDQVFPYDTIAGIFKQNMYFHNLPDSLTGINYNTENRCLLDGTGPYALDTAAPTPDLINGSNINLYKVLKSYGKATEYYLDKQMKHGLDKQDGANFHSDFGTGDTTAFAVYLYIVQRTCTFFQAVMNGATYSSFTVTKFTECENYRHNCQADTLPGSNNGCSNTDN